MSSELAALQDPPAREATTGQPATLLYDVFISYSHKDRSWVDEVLLPRLEAAGLKVCIDHRDFPGGLRSMKNMEQGVGRSRHVAAVLTPSWAASEWCQAEANLVLTKDPNNERRRFVPLMLVDCQPPEWIQLFSYRDFRDETGHDAQWPLLLRDLGASVEHASTTAKKGLKALFELLTSHPKVRLAVAGAQHSLTDVSQRITVLNAYKALHDRFQTLEDSYRMIAEFASRPLPVDGKTPALTDQDWTRLSWTEPDFQSRIEELFECARQGPFADDPVQRLWMAKLEESRKQLRAAVENQRFEQLLQATTAIGDVLRKEPSRLNGSLIAAAKALRLSDLVEALNTIWTSLSKASLPPDQRERVSAFKVGIDGLATMRVSLESQITSHDLLQTIRDELYSIDARMFRTLSEFETVWQYQRMLLEQLRTRSQAPWVQEVQASVDKVESELRYSQNLIPVVRRFLDYTSLINRKFKLLDEELLRLGGRLLEFGTSLTGLLEEMQK